jgi:hypothetical protein
VFGIALLTAAGTSLVPKIALGRRRVPAEQSGATEAPKAAPSAAE